MTPVHLSEDLESFIRDAVRSGLYPSEDAVISDAVVRLRNAVDANVGASDEGDAPSGPGKKLTKQRFQRHLVNIGLLDPPPETDSGADDSLKLVDDEGEIVDEVIIRERLIEWLTGFLEK
jgi:Arc/MetJ-type ribon-helix-helix transcriptional regulator